MRYFTPELFVRLQECPGPEALGAINEAWEQAASRYWAQLQEIAPGLPHGLRRFVKWGSLHDARVLEVGATQRRLTMVLLEDKAPRLVSLTWALVEAPVIDRTAIPAEHRTMPTLWLYDEVERDAEMLYNVRLRVQGRGAAAADGWRPIFRHSILLSNGWEVRLRFHRLTATRTAALLGAEEPAAVG